MPSNTCSTAQTSQPTFEQTENFLKAELFEAAECSARSLIRTQPESADAYYLLGYILNRRNKPDESLKEYTTGARFRKPGPNDLAVVALDYVLLKDYGDAEKWMLQASGGDPSNPLYLYYQGRIEYNLNAFNKAIATFQHALELSPNDTRDLYNLGLSYEGLNKPDEAAALYKQAIAGQETRPVQDAQPYYDLGSLLLRQNQNSDALPLLQKAAALDPQNPAIRESLAKNEEQMGQLTESRKDLESAIAAAPGVFSLHFELGRVYQKLHMTAEAKQQFDICAQMDAAHAHPGDASENLDFSRQP